MSLTVGLIIACARVSSATPGGFALSGWPVERASAGFRCSRKGLFRLLVHLFYVIVLAFVIVCSVRMVSGVDRLTKEVCERKIVEEIHFESEIQPALNQLRNKMGNDCKV